MRNAKSKLEREVKAGRLVLYDMSLPESREYFGMTEEMLKNSPELTEETKADLQKMVEDIEAKRALKYPKAKAV